MVKSQKKLKGLLSDKSIYLMIIISLIFNSVVYIHELIRVVSLNPKLLEIGWLAWIGIVLFVLILFNLLLWISLIVSILNIKKTKVLYLWIILICLVLNLILVFQSFATFNYIFWLFYLIQAVVLCDVLIVRLCKNKKGK